MVTLKQIAEQANVSIRSVSVVLNGKAVESRISAEVTRKIEAIARELNYRPNAMARAIRLKKTFQVGVLVRELSNPYTGAVVEAIEKSLLKHGYRLLLGLTNSSPEVGRAYLGEFSQGVVDGILNLDPLMHEADFVTSQVSVPYIHFTRVSPMFSLRVDYNEGVRLALAHLWKLGHRRIGFISGPHMEDASADGRLMGYIAFFEGQGLRLPPIEFGSWSFESGREAASKLLDQGCTAIFAANDLMAVGAVKAAVSRKLGIPSDVSIVGFDDSLLALMADPSLTTVRVPLEKLAELSVTGLLARIQGKPTGSARVVKPTLVVRDSSGAVAAGG